MFEDVGLQPPQHVGPQHVVELLDLVLLGDVRKLLQEALQVAEGESVAAVTQCLTDIALHLHEPADVQGGGRGPGRPTDAT